MLKAASLPRHLIFASPFVLVLGLTSLGSFVPTGARLERALVVAYAAPLLTVVILGVVFVAGRRTSQVAFAAALVAFVATTAIAVLR